jgi:hypothetical protein
LVPCMLAGIENIEDRMSDILSACEDTVWTMSDSFDVNMETSQSGTRFSGFWNVCGVEWSGVESLRLIEWLNY